jgi:secondary thiamine-phosphate synthase enzyme
MLQKFTINTKSKVEFQDITGTVRDAVNSAKLQNGVCYVFVPHTTAGVTINEHADPSVVRDIAERLDALIPQHDNYRHTEGNSPAHIKASILGNSETLLVEEGKLVLGTWQGVFFCEFDGPRNRTLLIKLVPDGK